MIRRTSCGDQMAATGRTLCSLGLASALLASVVPGVFEHPATPVIAAEAIASALPLSVPKRSSAGSRTRDVVLPVVAPKPAKPRTHIVPAGCERLVSPLARSTASATLGRCIT